MGRPRSRIRAVPSEQDEKWLSSPTLTRPLGPRHYPAVWMGLLGQHRQVLQEVTVGVAEVHGNRWHPADDARLRGLRPEEREGCDTTCAQAVTRVQDVSERNLEGHMQRQPQ